VLSGGGCQLPDKSTKLRTIGALVSKNTYEGMNLNVFTGDDLSIQNAFQTPKDWSCFGDRELLNAPDVFLCLLFSISAIVAIPEKAGLLLYLGFRGTLVNEVLS